MQLESRFLSPDIASKPQVVRYIQQERHPRSLGCVGSQEVASAGQGHSLFGDATSRGLCRAQGVAEDRIFAISATSAANTESVVHSVRQVLKDLPENTATETNARNLQRPIRSGRKPQIEDFVVRVQKDVTRRQHAVAGEVIELSTFMTNWTY